jgi:hypothetical protein
VPFSSTYVGILVTSQAIQAANGVNPNHGALVDLLESIENCLKGLDTYTKTPPNPVIDETVFNIIIEILSTLALATKELKEGQLSESVLADVLPILNTTQSNLSRKERRTLRMSCKSSYRATRPGQLQLRLLRPSTVTYRI